MAFALRNWDDTVSDVLRFKGGLDVSTALRSDVEHSLGRLVEVHSLDCFRHLKHNNTQFGHLVTERRVLSGRVKHSMVSLLQKDVHSASLLKYIDEGEVVLSVLQPLLSLIAHSSVAWAELREVGNLSEVRPKGSEHEDLIEVLHEVFQLHSEDPVILAVPFMYESLRQQVRPLGGDGVVLVLGGVSLLRCLGPELLVKVRGSTLPLDRTSPGILKPDEVMRLHLVVLISNLDLSGIKDRVELPRMNANRLGLRVETLFGGLPHRVEHLKV